MFTYYLWIKSIKTGSVYYATFTALSYFYMVSAWGGYVFITNLIPLHVFALILMNRFSHRIYVAYNTFFIVGLICSMQVINNLFYIKVHIFWEGHKNLRNLHCKFALCSNGQIYRGDFAKFWGHLRIYELYKLISYYYVVNIYFFQNKLAGS